MKNKNVKYLIYLLTVLVVFNTTIALAAKPDRNKSPEPVASADLTSGLAALEVQFIGSDSTDSDGVIISYYWDFGDGNTSDLLDPTHIYQSPNAYSATLTVTDDDNASKTSPPISILVDEPPINVPKKIRFQGRLKNDDGSDVNEILTQLTFNIYNVEIGGTPLWSEIQQNISVDEGRLDAILNLESAGLSFTEPYYLGVEINSDGEMAPRFEMTSVPYAFVSEK